MIIPQPLPILRLADMMLALQKIDSYYVWGHQSRESSDCSGHQIWRWRALGVIAPRADATCNGLFRLMGGAGKVDEPYLGCVAFYGENFTKITHCAYCLDSERTIDAIGSSKIDSIERAKVEDARFRVMDMHRRHDLLTFLDPFLYHKHKGATDV